MKTKKYKIAAILGLNCGLEVYRLLRSIKDIELISVSVLNPKLCKNIAGYIDLSAFISPAIFSYYKNMGDVFNNLKGINNIDMVIAVGISDIIPKKIINLPKVGVLGAHAAKLPDRPGSSPIIWAILDNLKETEMTIFKMEESIDSGAIYASKKIKILPDSNSEYLRQKMDKALIYLIKKNIIEILSGKNIGIKQIGKRNYTRRRNLKDGQLNLYDDSEQIIRKIRALNAPYPGAHFYAGDGKAIIIEKAKIGNKELNYSNLVKNHKEKVLCIVAHPDDEALGVGGTLIKHIESGDNVDIIIFSEGEDAKVIKKNKDSKRTQHAKDWCTLTGCNLYALYDFPDQALDTVPQIKMIKLLEQAITEIQPSIVYIHHPGDMNSDHQTVAQVSLAAMRPMNKNIIQPEIRAFETPSSTDQSPMIEPYLFKPNFYVSVAEQWDKKIKSLKIYSKELGKGSHPRSLSAIKSLARKRGSESGFYLSEAFYIVKKLWN